MVSDILSDAVAQLRGCFRSEIYDEEMQGRIAIAMAVMDWVRTDLDTPPIQEARDRFDRLFDGVEDSLWPAVGQIIDGLKALEPPHLCDDCKRMSN